MKKTPKIISARTIHLKEFNPSDEEKIAAFRQIWDNLGHNRNQNEKTMTSRDKKSIAVKGLRLQKYLTAYHADGRQKKETKQKFVNVWGESMANHFLSKYDDAESLIWAFDQTNLELFIKKF